MPSKSTQGISSVSAKNKILQELQDLVTQIREESRVNAARIKPLAEQMIALAQSIENKNYEGLAKIELAHYVCSTENDYMKSVQLCDEGIQLTSGVFRKKIKPYYHLNKGRAYQHIGERIASQNEYLDAVRLMEFRQDLNANEKRWLASTYYNLFILFNQEGVEFTQEEYLQKAFEIYEAVGDKSGISNCYNSFAVLHYKKKDYSKSLVFLKKAYDFSLQSNALNYQSIFCSNIGLVYSKTGNLAEGLLYFEKAKQINKEIKSKFHDGHTHQQIGEAFFTNGEYEKALTQYKAAEKIFLQIGIKQSLTTIYQYTSEVYEKLRNFEQAFSYQKKYAAALVEHFNDEKTFAIAKARNQFDLEKKERETKILLQKNEEIGEYVMQLEVSNNQLKQFAHIASHDLKEPLRMVSAYAKLLERSLSTKLSTDEKEYLQFLLQGTVTMQNLVTDLLTLSNINYVAEKTPVQLNKLLKLTLTNLDSTIREKNAKVVFDDLPTVAGDETQFLQLFQNLISNAIKYNESKMPTVKISYIKKRSFYEFIFSDNGIGIPEEYREKVFQIFQRLHTRDAYSGTGIGLTICKKIIDQFGGTIRIEGNTKGGCNFIFTLPIKSL